MPPMPQRTGAHKSAERTFGPARNPAEPEGKISTSLIFSPGLCQGIDEDISRAADLATAALEAQCFPARACRLSNSAAKPSFVSDLVGEPRVEPASDSPAYRPTTNKWPSFWLYSLPSSPMDIGV